MGEMRIAIIHDELTRRGGAEAVLEELLRIFPQADVYALYAGTPKITIDGTTWKIHTSFLQSFPLWFRRHPGRLLPLLPNAAERFDFSRYDVVLSSASGFAKSIITRVNVPHICFCHTPTRYLWDSTHEVLRNQSWAVSWLSRMAFHYLRLFDFAAAQRVDVFLANSEYTRTRIAGYYRRESTVVYPPIDTAFFTPGNNPRGAKPSWDHPFLAVGRLTRTKYFDHAIRACEKLQFPLVVVGRGREAWALKRMAGKYTRIVGKLSAEELRDYYRRATALLQPGVEDFGMAAAEALACGTPVIAYDRGGVREIVTHNLHGYLYRDQREEALAEAIRITLARGRWFEVEQLQRRALRFGRQLFRDGIYKEVEKALQSKRS